MKDRTSIAPLEIFNAENCQGVLDHLRVLGISNEAIAKAGGVVWANGHFSGRYFEPDPTGQRVMALSISRGNRIIEIVAFDKAHFGSLYGDIAFALGEEHLINPPVFSDPINIHPHPIQWLRNHCDGIVILRHQDVWFQLANYENLSCENVAHGRELERLLKPPPPRAKILVRQSKQVAA